MGKIVPGFDVTVGKLDMVLLSAAMFALFVKLLLHFYQWPLDNLLKSAANYRYGLECFSQYKRRVWKPTT